MKRRNKKGNLKTYIERMVQEIEARDMGLKIYAGESHKFSQVVTYNEIVQGLRKKKYKTTFTDKRTETDIMALIQAEESKH